MGVSLTDPDSVAHPGGGGAARIPFSTLVAEAIGSPSCRRVANTFFIPRYWLAQPSQVQPAWAAAAADWRDAAMTQPLTGARALVVRGRG